MSHRPSKKHRVIISGLLLVCLAGASFGLREIAAIRHARAVAAAQDSFQYHGLSREHFPRLYGNFLMRGQFAPFVEIAEAMFPIPGLAENYVPQGMAYSEALGAFVLTFYYHDYSRPSLLALVDAKTGEWIKRLDLLNPDGLPWRGHAGGAAAWGEHVWVSSGGTANRLAVEDLRAAEDRGSVRFRDSFSIGTRGCIAFAAGNTLWLGDFHREGHSDREYFAPQRCEESGNHAWIAGFRLSHSEPMGVVGLRRGGNTPAPRYVLSIPDHAQGATLATTGEFVLSTSFAARRASYLWVFPRLQEILGQAPARYVTVGRHRGVPLWVLCESGALHRQIMPSMSEGITQREGYVYVNFESAALMYRERALLFSDHVFRMPESALIPAEMVKAAVKVV